MISLNTGLSLTILALFFIVIMVGYVYIDETRKNNQEAKEAIVDAKAAIEVVNKTQHSFMDQWKQKQNVDNVRFNDTLNQLHETYELIVDNQKLIINLSDISGHNSESNLNLTKFNRAAIVDSNNILRQLADYLNFTDVKQFNSSRIG